MSRKSENRKKVRASARSRRRMAWWAGGGAAVAVLVAVAAVVGRGDAQLSHHPEPRIATERSAVVPAARYASYPRVVEAYEAAAAASHVLDGLYCYCECNEHSGHYSLLDCFHSDHGARCDVCMSEAMIAYQMDRRGATLDEIRGEIDRTFRR